MAFLLYDCAPKATKTTDKSAYEEDLSVVRFPIDSVTAPERTEVAKAPYKAPESDITRRLNVVVDSIAAENSNKKLNVFTIQVYVGNNREEANDARSEVYKIIPDETPKLEYSAPNYRVKVGTFSDRLDAHKTLTLLKKSFPSAILLAEKVDLKN